jgi:hypothetical protein
VKQQALGDPCRFGDVACRDIVKVTGGEVLDGGFEELASGQFSLHTSLRCGWWRLPGGHWSMVRQKAG